MCDRMSPRDRSATGNITSSTPYGFANVTTNAIDRSDEQPSLSPVPRSVAVDPAAEQVQGQIREAEREAAVGVRPEPEQHREHDERMATDDAVGHFDDPEQHQEEEHADQERALRPEGVDPRERGERDPAGHQPVAREPQAPGGTRADRCPRRRAPTKQRTPNAPNDPVQDPVGDLGEPRLRDPLRTRSSEREDVVVRDAVVEDVLAGAQVPEERVVGELRDADRPAERARRSR